MNNEFSPVAIIKEHYKTQIPYWIECGTALLEGDEALKQKWINFVNETVNGLYGGLGINETLQIMSMFKMRMPIENIKQVIETIPSKDIIINYLEQFIHPELVSAIDTNRHR